jgi:N-acetylglucosaminyl-diphospho-decaprenol L-rhamnosyltransferase
MNISIIIVSYNTREMTLNCIESVFKQTRGCTFEVIVIDNNSQDGSAEAIARKWPEIRTIASVQNDGFARANNIAAAYAKGDYILLLNPDTIVLDGAIQKLHHFAEQNPDAGIFGGSTFFSDGTRNPTSCWSKPSVWSMFVMGIGLCSIFRNSRLFNPESFNWWKWDRVREVDIVTGCFLMIKKNLWNRLKGFDTAFFMYSEDADLCIRAKKIGGKSLVYPDARIIHIAGASEKVRTNKMITLFKSKSQLLKKHYSRSVARYGSFMLSFYSWTRMAATFAISRIRKNTIKNYDSWKTIWQRRNSWQKIE